MSVTAILAITGISCARFGWRTWRFGNANIAAVEACFARNQQSAAA
jgi:hypothetical protein